MKSIQGLEKIRIPMSLIQSVANIHVFKGKQELYKEQSPEVLNTLQNIAVVQSTESSNRIEGIEISNLKLREIMNQKTSPKTRNEREISGYRDVLATIHASALDISIRPQTILQLHRDLYKFLPGQGGKWKPKDNYIEEVHPDGTKRVRFAPVSAFLTPEAMEELCKNFNLCRDKGDFEDL
ncbi:MAG: cell filamentation protein Fic, partial [Firmicutes bacterium]|nr:cell filamentation protein Fic [Bacillota bacterium]